jgi:hypothetical protein
VSKARCRETVECFFGIKNLSLFYLVPPSIMNDIITMYHKRRVSFLGLGTGLEAQTLK